MSKKNVLLIDNYDSFTYNIVQYLKELGCNVQIYMNDEIKLDKLEKESFSAVIISPGPGTPDNSGISLKIIEEFYKTKKILGVCLGHQCIAQYFGCKVIKSKNPVHGKTSKVYFEQNKLFEGIKQGFEATRYHSLVVDNETLSGEIIPLAYTKDKTLMALKHRHHEVYGVQFHPEAILTESGKQLLENFVTLGA